MDAIVVLGSTFSFLFRAIVAQPYLVPSTSMAPTLEAGDYAWATKFSYGWSNLSLPFGERMPAFTYARTSPERGDVVVYRLPESLTIDRLGRIIGLPGDTVAMTDGVVYINGKAVQKEAAGSYSGVSSDFNGARLFTETLPEGRRYSVMDTADDAFTDNSAAKAIPAGHFYVMGDNRDNSNDSRFNTGFVPEANIVGKILHAITWPDGKFTMRDVK